MAYQVLARKYRPQRFADVVGQDHVTVTLMNALAQNRIAHGYIFSGHRGIGKTTIARILAMALNCEFEIGSAERPTPEPCLVCTNCREISSASRVGVDGAEELHSFDVEEIDAATRRGIDDAKLLTAKALVRPTLKSRYKILILDEAHQLTDAAWNALLKTLEEPPSWLVFMFATTQPEDIPQTVRSRCQHFSFHAVKLVDILGQLRSIAQAEGVAADEDALSLLAEAGDGSMRDALSIMDQAIASAPSEPSREGSEGHARLDAGQIRELMGTVPNAVFERIMEAVDGNRSAEVMTMANQLLDAGNSPAQLARQCVRYLRNALIAKVAGLSPDGEAAEGIGSELLQISPDEQRRAARTAGLFGEEELTRFLQVMLRTFDELGYRQEQRFHFELGLLKLVHLGRLLPLEEALSRAAGGARGPASTGTLRSTSAPARPATAQPANARSATMPLPVPGAPARPAFSPFEQDKNRRRPESSAGGPMAFAASAASNVVETRGANAVSIAPVHRAAPQTARQPLPAPVVQPEALSFRQPSHLEQQVEQQADVPLPSPVFASTAAAVPPEVPTSLDVAACAAGMTAPQRAVVEALTAAKLTSAADAMADAVWTVTDDQAQVQTELSKIMLPVVINQEAEKIVRGALHQMGIARLTLLTGAAAPAAQKKPRPASSGSVQAKAMEHPMVQQAQRLFNAAIQTVIDLRESD